MLVVMKPVFLGMRLALKSALNFEFCSAFFQEFHRISIGATMNLSSTLRTQSSTQSSTQSRTQSPAQSFTPLRPPAGLQCAVLQRIVLQPIQQWLDTVEVRNSTTAHRIAKFIPAQCPFERDVKFFGRTVAHIPPLCKLNPLYEQFVGLRFRALCYLADECGEDIQQYC